MHGYQRDDARAFDYHVGKTTGISCVLRGPLPETLPQSYAVAIGAAQTFGRFVQQPYPALLTQRTGRFFLNLGLSGAGPATFLRNPELMSAINKAEFAIVQVMSGRSVDNSIFVCGENQGTVRRCGAVDAPFRLAEIAYTEYLREATEADLIQFRREIRQRYVAEMRELLARIERPTILLYWSTRQPAYESGVKLLGAYWAAYPHFVNDFVIEQLKPYASAYLEVVSGDGLPEPLYDRKTKEPFLMWSEELFPSVIYRYHNNYYPSRQMHEQAAAALAEGIEQLREAGQIGDWPALVQSRPRIGWDAWKPGRSKTISLTGAFSAEELEGIAAKMRQLTVADMLR